MNIKYEWFILKTIKSNWKKKYSLEQLNSLLHLGLRVQIVDSYIRIITNDYYSFDQNLKLCLSFVETDIPTHFGLKFKFYIK